MWHALLNEHLASLTSFSSVLSYVDVVAAEARPTQADEMPDSPGVSRTRRSVSLLRFDYRAVLASWGV